MTVLQFIARIQTLHTNKPALLLVLDTAPLTAVWSFSLMYCSIDSTLRQLNTLLKRQQPPPNKVTAHPAARSTQQKRCSTGSSLSANKCTVQPAAPFSQQTYCSTSSTLLPTNALLSRQHLSCRQVHYSTSSTLLPTNALLKQQDPPPNKHTTQPAGPLSHQTHCSTGSIPPTIDITWGECKRVKCPSNTFST